MKRRHAIQTEAASAGAEDRTRPNPAWINAPCPNQTRLNIPTGRRFRIEGDEFVEMPTETTIRDDW